ncbi:MAG: LuxR C-terminal-related transcriptional regulator [Candidatus Polarisedimenticolia bacterium]
MAGGPIFPAAGAPSGRPWYLDCYDIVMAGPVELPTRCGSCALFGAIEGMSDGIVLVDLDERIFYMNRAAQEILKLAARPVAGTGFRKAVRHVGLATFWAASVKESIPVTTDLTLPGHRLIRATVSICLSSMRDPIGRMLTLHDAKREKRIWIDHRRAEMPAIEDSHAGPLAELTRREREVLSLLAEGLTNGGIADRLHVSMNTVASHLKSVYPKLNVSSRAQAAACAVTHGLFPTRVK